MTESNSTEENTEKTIEAPDYCRFAKGEVIPLRGYEWRVVGYTDDFMLVLKAVRMTGSEYKKHNLKSKKK